MKSEFRWCPYLPNTHCTGKACAHCGFVRVALANKDEEIERLKKEKDWLIKKLAGFHINAKDADYWLECVELYSDQ